jgi:hypothetical protein
MALALHLAHVFQQENLLQNYFCRAGIDGMYGLWPKVLQRLRFNWHANNTQLTLLCIVAQVVPLWVVMRA